VILISVDVDTFFHSCRIQSIEINMARGAPGTPYKMDAGYVIFVSEGASKAINASLDKRDTIPRLVRIVGDGCRSTPGNAIRMELSFELPRTNIVGSTLMYGLIGNLAAGAVAHITEKHWEEFTKTANFYDLETGQKLVDLVKLYGADMTVKRKR